MSDKKFLTAENHARALANSLPIADPLQINHSSGSFVFAYLRTADLGKKVHCKCRSANYGAMALTKCGITYFNAMPALWEEGNSCA